MDTLRCRMLKDSFSARLLKKVQMQGGARWEARGVLGSYVAAPRERANAADGTFSAACYAAGACWRMAVRTASAMIQAFWESSDR
jgi:hypothetical protein